MLRIAHTIRTGLVITAVGGGLLWSYAHLGVVAHARPSLAGAAVSATDSAALSDTISAILSRNSDLDTSVSITDLQTGKTYHWGETASYTAASLGKVITASAYLHQVEQGSTRLDDTVGDETARQQLTRLIEDSDNDAWVTLNENLTDDGLQSYARSIGLTTYSPSDNALTSNDIAMVFAKLYKGQLLNNGNTSFLLSLLQKANMQDYIVAGVPVGTTVYHKVGYLDDRLNEAAIITRDGRSYALAIFSKTGSQNYDFARGSALFKQITTASLQAFFP